MEKKWGIAEYLKAASTRGAMVRKVRLNAARRQVLRDFVKECIEEISIRFPVEGEEDTYCAALK